ncbi:hypothetical protein [Anaerococcus marasmi]|uniref:hypothetical protein n=1 Tax=Anaerococcus marasmi TaxID=2057797 RepID=UPI000CF96174|nr:hypothetical protein [Anaerococcus marasmi]
MKVIKVFASESLSYEYSTTSALKEKIDKTSDYEDLREVKFIIDNDKDKEKLLLLVILSPIFLASFDSSSEELDFFRGKISSSNFAYGLYPEFFPFDEEKYRLVYENKENKEDIFLNEEGLIEFTINPIGDEYILALAYLLEKLIEDDINRKKLLKYFDKIRNDIVINGRRSILANGIQAFYLSKYVLVRMITFCEDLIEKDYKAKDYLSSILSKSESLQRPIYE